MVACSGAFKDSSLKVFRRGISLKKISELGELQGITGLWALRAPGEEDLDKYAIMSFLDETLVFQIENGEVGET